MKFDGREHVFKSMNVLRSMNTTSVPYKWSELFKLAYQLGDKQLTEGLRKRIGEVEKFMGIDLYYLESDMYSSLYYDTFWLVGGNKVTEAYLNNLLNKIDTWLIGEMVRVQRTIKFSSPPPLQY